MTTEIKINIKNLSKSFRGHQILNNIELAIRKNSSLVILGGSGTGKSVLIKTIIGLLPPDTGSITIDGIEITHLSMQGKFALMKKCGFLFQGGALFDSLTVQENIVFSVIKTMKLSKQHQRDLAAAKLEAVGLSPQILDLYPAELSGGMQKRVALARTICGDPELIFFDEPTTGLDPIMSNVINELIIKITNKLNATTITITHDIKSAYMIAKEVALMYKGQIVWYGTKEDIKDNDNPYLHQFINGLSQGPIQF